MSDAIPAINMDAERSILSCVIQRPGEVIPLASRLISGEDFLHPAHRIVWDACLSTWHGLGALDVILLTDALRKIGKLDAVGGPSVCTGLFTFQYPVIETVPYYAELMREASHRRQIWAECRQAAEAAINPTSDTKELAAGLNRLLTRLSASGATVKTMKERVSDAFDRYQENFENRGSRPAGVIPTGIDKLDAELGGGAHPGELAVIAAETSGGKTALAMQMAENAAVALGYQVLCVSYEMTADQLVDRAIARHIGVPSFKLRSGLLSEMDFAKLGGDKMSALANAGLHLRDDVGHWTMDDVGTEARAIKAQHPPDEDGRGGLGLVVVDYLQLAAPKPAAKGRQINREREVAEMSRTGKNLAKELKIPVVVLSQLTDGKLRESRAIGHDADTVLRIKADSEERDDRRIILIDKQRHGARGGEIEVAWNGPLMKFS